MPGLMEGLFLLAAWAIVPLGLRQLPDSKLLRWAKRLQPVAAALATVSFFLPKGIPAAALAIPWLSLDALLALAALFGLPSALRGGIPALLLTAAMGFPTVGGVHLVASRYGYPLAGFPEPIILLTAIHFHYTAFAVPILAALAKESRLAILGGAGVVGGTPLLAAGFLFSPILKVVGVGVLCVSVAAVAVGQLRATDGARRSLLLVSSLSVLAGMALAAVYEHGFYTGRTWIAIPTMAWSHGILNGVGFSLCGLLGRPRRSPPEAMRHSPHVR